MLKALLGGTVGDAVRLSGAVRATSNATGELSVEPSAGGVAGSGEKEPTKRPRRRQSDYIVHGGRREVNAYPLTENDLTQLGLVQGGATFAISFAVGLLGFWLNITQSMAFAPGTPEKIIAFWDGLRLAALIGSGVFALLGAFLIYLGWSTIGRIKRETKHDKR